MTQAIAYLTFDGRCADAMHFYEQALGGRLDCLLRGKDTPMRDQMPPGFDDRVMHARLVLPGGGTLYAGDCPAGQYRPMQGFSIAIDYETEERAQQVFDALAEGGQVMMPMQPTFWAGRWGMVVDRFGTPWNINGAPKPV